MSSENIEVSIARMQEQLKAISDDLRESRESRKLQYAQQEKLAAKMDKLDYRLEKVEGFVAGAGPQLTEITALKLKAQGAGWLGKWLWLLAGASIGGAASLMSGLHKLFGN